MPTKSTPPQTIQNVPSFLRPALPDFFPRSRKCGGGLSYRSSEGIEKYIGKFRGAPGHKRLMKFVQRCIAGNHGNRRHHPGKAQLVAVNSKRPQD